MKNFWIVLYLVAQPQPRRHTILAGTSAAACLVRGQGHLYFLNTGNRVFGWESLHPKGQQPKILSAFNSRLRSGQSWAGVAMDPAANRREQLREWAWQSRLSILNLNDSSSSADTGSGNLRAFEWCHACGDASCLARMLGCCLVLVLCWRQIPPNGFPDCNTMSMLENTADGPRLQINIILHQAPISTSPSKPPGGLQRQCCVVHSSFKLFTGVGNYHN
jgi:hypothetical protein